jgi:hypothetical protein
LNSEKREETELKQNLMRATKILLTHRLPFYKFVSEEVKSCFLLKKKCYLYEKEENIILINFKQVCIKSSSISFVCLPF